MTFDRALDHILLALVCRPPPRDWVVVVVPGARAWAAAHAEITGILSRQAPSAWLRVDLTGRGCVDLKLPAPWQTAELRIIDPLQVSDNAWAWSVWADHVLIDEREAWPEELRKPLEGALRRCRERGAHIWVASAEVPHADE
jgi:hypothetical protein